MSDRSLPAVAFALLGAFSMAAQTALFREYLVVYGGNELGAGFFFASWLGWVGVGAVLAGRLLRIFPALRAKFPALLALYPVALLVQLLLIRSLRSLAGVAPTDLFPTRSLFLATLLTNAPVSLVTGLLFPSAVAWRSEDEPARAVGRVYILECLGSFAGGAGLTAFLFLGNGALPALPMLAAALAAAGLLLSLRSRLTAASGAHGLILAASILLSIPGVGRFVVGALDEEQIGDLYPDAEVVAVTETPYRRLAVVEIGGQTVALANGKILTAWPAGEAALQDAALLVPQPRRCRSVLLIGSGLEPLASEMLRHPVERLRILEPDRAGHAFLRAHLPPESMSALDDVRVEVRYGDPRAALDDPEVFDLIVVAPGDPDSALTARTFTREFYALAARHLADGGIVATPLASGENYLGPELSRYGASVRATLAEVFPKVVIAPGETAWFIAGEEPTLDPAVLSERLRALPVTDRRFEPERIHQLLEPRRIAFAEEAYRVPASEDLVSTDDRPLTYLLNLLVLARMEGAGPSRVILAIREAGIGIFLLPFVVLLLFRFRYAIARPAASARFAGRYVLFVAGGAAIALDLVLLLLYQERHGLLFERVGLANALFMLGLFGGGVAGAAAARAVPHRGAMSAGTAATLAAAFAVALPIVARSAGEGGFLLLFLTAGGVSGAAFPLAAALFKGEAGEAGAALEAADHWGGAVGAAIVGVMLVPLFGTAATLRLTAVALLTAPLLLGLEALARGPWPSRILGARLRRIRSRLTTFPSVASGFVLAGIVTAAALVSLPVRTRLDRPVVRLSPERLRAVVTADRHIEVEEPFLHYDAWNRGDETPVSHTLATRAVVDDVSGYGGPLNLLLSVDRDAMIRRVSLLESKETPAYIGELPRFLDDLAGRSAEKEIRLEDVVKITGATVTCRAAVETVNRANGRVVADLLGGEPAVRAAGPGPLANLGVTEAATALLFLLAVPVFLRGGGRLRTGFLVVVVVVLGILLNQQLSVEAVTDVLTFSLPPTGNPALWILVVGTIALGVAFGQIYCGLLCPFGAAQELLGKLGLLTRVSPELDRRARFVKHVVLAVTAAAFLLGGAGRVTGYDPLAVAFSGLASGAMWALIALVLFLSLFYFRFWCRYLCPVGAFLSLTNRLALLSGLGRVKDFRRCDLGARSKLDMDCLHCNRCITKAAEGER